MRSLKTPAFSKMLDGLPREVQEQARQCFQKWKERPSSVGWHRINGARSEMFAANIGLRYRAIGIVDKTHGAVVWMFVGSHESYNNWIDIRKKDTQTEVLRHFQERLAEQRQSKLPRTRDPVPG